MFADFARIHIRSGKGGDGHVSFRREKFVPNGGPDGGDGGRGGSVIFEVDKAMNTLFYYRHRYQFRAQDGEQGGKRRCHGANGEDIILKVPEGTIVREEHTGKVIADLSGDTQRVTVLRGGRGGRGNMNFATSTNQAPQYGEPGKPALELDVTLELKMVADVALVGFPNAGKSTFLSRVTNADPKIASYPFTTIDPNLGVVDFGDGGGFVIADMPGLIEGASEGVGLGHRFLKHIERTRVLIHIVDAAAFDGRDPVDDVVKINEELEKFNPDIMKKPMVIAANKVDCILLNDVRNLLATSAPKQVYYEQEYFPEDELMKQNLPYTVTKDEDSHTHEQFYRVEGPLIEKMLDYTNLDTERGFVYFGQFLKRHGINEALKEAGAKDGDTVKMYGQQFEYYDETADIGNEDDTEGDEHTC